MPAALLQHTTKHHHKMTKKEAITFLKQAVYIVAALAIATACANYNARKNIRPQAKVSVTAVEAE